MKFFKALSLMFGTIAALYAFLATTLSRVSVVEFFDDISQVESRRLAESAQEAIE